MRSGFINVNRFVSSTSVLNYSNNGDFLRTTVKKWFRDKDFGYLENGSGPDIKVTKADLVNCQFLKIGVTVEFECHPDKQGLIGKKVKLVSQRKSNNPKKGHHGSKNFPFGVMS